MLCSRFELLLFIIHFDIVEQIFQEASSPNRTLDLASALEIGPAGSRAPNDSANSGCTRSVMTIAFEFAFESHMQEHVASMARQYVRSIISSVQRVALALSPSHLSSHAGLRSPLGTPEAQTLARWICNSYRYNFPSNTFHLFPVSGLKDPPLHVAMGMIFIFYNVLSLITRFSCSTCVF